MQQFDKAHFTRPSPDRSTDHHESVPDAAVLELNGEATRHRLQVARQRLRERGRAHSNWGSAYDNALAWVERIERGE